MIPISFPESNITFGKGQPEYIPLPAFVVQGDPELTVVTCWKLSEEEIDILIKTKAVWCSQHTFGCALQPQLLSVEKPEFVV